jgi:hypothetical protein
MTEREVYAVTTDDGKRFYLGAAADHHGLAPLADHQRRSHGLHRITCGARLLRNRYPDAMRDWVNE